MSYAGPDLVQILSTDSLDMILNEAYSCVYVPPAIHMGSGAL